MSKIFSIVVLVILSPILIIVAFVVVLSDGFPILFKQKRIGINNSEFWIYKFRTMKKNTPDVPTHLMNNTKNPFTKVGPFLRKFSLDELPQLFNIILGDMVFIGPRPALYNQDDLIKLRTKLNIHTSSPGLTGWAQVNGRDSLTIQQKVEMDHYYMINKSFTMNLKIIWLSIIKVLKSEDIA